MSVTPPIDALDRLSFQLIGTRSATRVYWTINVKGQGEISAQLPLGWIIENRDTGIGDYHFAQGIHRFDIGPNGYRMLHDVLKDFVSGKAASAMSNDAYSKCKRDADAGRVLSWQQNELDGSFMLPSGCDSAIKRTAGSMLDSSWRVLARMLMRQSHAAVSETMPGLKPVIRKPLILSMTVINGWTGNVIDWEVKPDGSGWFKTTQAITLPAPGPHSLPTSYIGKGKHKLDIGKTGYLALRREMDAYILGAASETECVGTLTDQPMARLRWSEKGKVKEGLSHDTGCSDYGERVAWAVNFLGARVAMQVMTVDVPPPTIPLPPPAPEDTPKADNSIRKLGVPLLPKWVNQDEETGIIVLGSWGSRRAYAPLNRIIVPKDFLGMWSVAELGCDESPAPTLADNRAANGRIIITSAEIVTQIGRASYRGAYVLAEGSVTLARAKQRKQVKLSAGKFRHTHHIILMASFPKKGDNVDLFTFERSEEPMQMSITANNQNALKLVRCPVASLP